MPLAPVAIAFAAGVGLAPWARPDVAWTTWLAALASTGALLLRGRTSGATALLLVGVAAVGALHGIEAPLPPGHVARLDLPRTAHVDGRLVAEPVWWAPDRVRLLIEAVDALDLDEETDRSEEHTSELQSHSDLVCRLLLEKKKNDNEGDRRRHLQE